jgi:hypothetical protein
VSGEWEHVVSAVVELPEDLRIELRTAFDLLQARIIPNRKVGDRVARDLGLLPNSGLAAFLGGKHAPLIGHPKLLDLIERVAIDHGILFGDEDRELAAAAKKLQYLTLILIRDHCKNSYDIGEPEEWPIWRKILWAIFVKHERRRRQLTSDRAALLILDKSILFTGSTIKMLVKHLRAGRRFLNQRQGRGRPRAAPGGIWKAAKRT